ncbi:MAG: FAD binding domain-containing protein [Pyrinomonadaceae bacterium]
MMRFILNNENISTDLPPGITVLDFVRYHKNLKGTKIGCREGDCGACTILVGELVGNEVKYRSMTCCLMPLANASGKHLVTVEGINPPDRGLTPVQQAMLDESGTQCGFCTVGFVMSLTGFCIDETAKTPEMAVSSVDGNICRCTGYKSIERAADKVSVDAKKAKPPALAGGIHAAIENSIVPGYFHDIGTRLKGLAENGADDAASSGHPLTRAVLPFVGGGTDVYVQKPDAMIETESTPLFYNETLRGIRDAGEYIEIGASATVTDLLVSPVMQSIFPDLYKHLKLVSSTPIRNMATLAGNFINASPIGDMTVWFLALDAEIDLCASPQVIKGYIRTLALKDLYLDYKQLAKANDEYVTTIRFRKPTGDFRFNFEKVCKRTYLDIATVNTAISIQSEPPAVAGGLTRIKVAHVAAGGVSPIPLYLKQTSAFLGDKEMSEETITAANEIMQSEISPISDVRGTADYKRLLLRQLFRAHFVELYATEHTETTE